jgi:NifU-like protein involved in Fe-S cluster formation
MPAKISQYFAVLVVVVHSLKEIFLCYLQVLDHYENPRNVGSLDKSDRHVGTGLVGAPACGDVMKLQIKVDDNGKIIDAKFKTFGCGSAIASSSLATEWVKGKSVSIFKHIISVFFYIHKILCAFQTV